MREKCAVFGIRSGEDVFDSIYYGLYSMQHRGQESAGIATYSNRINLHKDTGLVPDVFKDIHLEGNYGIGHVRYSTTGESNVENTQPLMINYAKGSFAIAHNGNLVNSQELRSILERRGSVFSTTTDTEIIAQLIAQEHLKTDSFIKGIMSAMSYLRGAYSLVILCKDQVIGVRDPWAIRPLILGRSDDTYAIASESCALDALGIKVIRDIKPSEILVITDTLNSYFGRKERTAHCMFEYVYFARPDSIINGISVYEVRKTIGKILAKEAPIKADMVVPIPDSGTTAAIGYAKESGMPYGEGLIKNRYLGRTFIMPEQKERDIGVKIKLNPIRSEIENKNLIVVDDSIVRGTTIRRIIKTLREYGANKIHVRVSCPPIRFPCYYGIDMQSREEFIAQKKSIEEIKKEIGADTLAYTSLKGLVKSIGLPKEKLCLACLTGGYPVVEEQIKLQL